MTADRSALDGRTDRFLVVSTDSHAGPSMERQLRPYCPSRHLAQFDEFVAAVRRHAAEQERLEHPERRKSASGVAFDVDPSLSQDAKHAYAAVQECAGLQDPQARLQDMDAQGVAADVIFAGGENVEELPFMGFGADAGPAATAGELRAVGGHIWNQWLAEFVSVAPERMVGVMQIPIWDVDKAVAELEWGMEAGLKAVNLPAPRSDFPLYVDPVYEPLWSAVEASGLPLVTHVGGGEPPLGWPGPAPGLCLMFAELDWLARRGLWQMIFGGVFERHPGLKLVYTETRVVWVQTTLADLDAIYLNDMVQDIRRELPRLPSEYWETNCYIGGSFLAPFEVARRDEVGLRNLMWGSDYPHVEGCWPRTRLSMRNTFCDVPEPEARMILGTNALDVYNLDADALQPVVDRIGPTVEEISRPLEPDEVPAFKSGAFRRVGIIA
jgi:predicted TIM-barrel fold metal-dependent hydrolase